MILGRLAKRTVPSALKSYVTTFKTEYGGFQKANQVVEAAREKRDEALDKVGDADDGLDVDVETLAQEMVGAKMGKRSNPFIGFSRHSPSTLVRLPYATEATEVLSLVTAVTKQKPAPAVTKALAKCKSGAASVKAALDALTDPQTRYSTALTARDTLLPGCTKALRKLKTQAKAAWDDEPGVYDAIFAPPDRVQAPKRSPKKKSNGSVKAAKPSKKAAKPAKNAPEPTVTPE